MSDIVLDEHVIEAEQHSVVTANTTEVCQEAADALAITAVRNEYSIVGDGLYASISAEESPQWLLNIIDSVVSGIIAGKVTDLQTAIGSINQSLLELDIAKNQYEELINIEETIDSVITTKLETLNATVNGNSANILELDTAKVTADEALAISVDHLNAQIAGGDIYALVTQLSSAIANSELSSATQINSLEAVFGENQSTIEQILTSNADAYSTESNAVTDLLGVQRDEFGNIISTSGIVGSLIQKTSDNLASAGHTTEAQAYLDDKYAAMKSGTTVDIIGDVVNTGFAYNSAISVNGVNYESGFGLSTVYNAGVPVGSGTPVDPYQSEFWVNAEKFRFTNSAESGTTAPFTIDASGATPQITFNGVVSFTNVDGAPTVTSGTVNPTSTTEPIGSTYHNTTDDSMWTYTSAGWIAGGNPDALVAADLGPTGTTVIDGGRISTDSISAISANLGTINAGVMYSSLNAAGTGPSTALDYAMKIDLNNGEIHIV